MSDTAKRTTSRTARAAEQLSERTEVGYKFVGTPDETGALLAVVAGYAVDPLQIKALVTTMSVLGSQTAAARFFEVARSQPGRWIKGTERPNPRARRLIQDLDYVWDRLTDDRGREAANIWLRSPNAFLDGVTPLGWLKSRGAHEVIAAIDAEEAGSYA